MSKIILKFAYILLFYIISKSVRLRARIYDEYWLFWFYVGIYKKLEFLLVNSGKNLYELVLFFFSLNPFSRGDKIDFRKYCTKKGNEYFRSLRGDLSFRKPSQPSLKPKGRLGWFTNFNNYEGLKNRNENIRSLRDFNKILNLHYLQFLPFILNLALIHIINDFLHILIFTLVILLLKQISIIYIDYILEDLF